MSRIEAAMQRARRETAAQPVEPRPASGLDAWHRGSELLDSAAPPDKAVCAPRPATEKLVTVPELDQAPVEQYRRLAAALHQLQLARDIHVLMITSAIAGEGKTLTAANLALTFAESYQRRVLLIDADLRRPAVRQLFDLPESAGLADLLRSGDTRQAPHHVTSRLAVLPAGAAASDPMSLLTSERMSRVVEEAAAAFDWVILDTPPVGLLPDANLLSTIVDGVVLVVGAGSTPLETVRRSADAVGRDRIVGMVLNRIAPVPFATDHDYMSYGRGYGRAT